MNEGALPFMASDLAPSMDSVILLLSASLALVALWAASSFSRPCCNSFRLYVMSISLLLFSDGAKGGRVSKEE